MQDFLTAIAHPVRRAALHILWDDSEHCVCELMAKLDATQSRMSRHMQVLRQAGLVIDRRDAQWVRYRINPDLPPSIAGVLQAVCQVEIEQERSVA